MKGPEPPTYALQYGCDQVSFDVSIASAAERLFLGYRVQQFK